MISAQDVAEMQAFRESQQPQSEGEYNLKEQVSEKLGYYILQIANLDQRHLEIINPENDTEEVAKVFKRLVKNLKTLKSHFEFVLGTLTAKTEEVLLKGRSFYTSILPRYPENFRGSDVSLIPLNEALDTVVRRLIIDLEKVTNNFFIEKNKVREINKSRSNLAQVQIVASKVEVVIEYFPGLTALPPDDIFSQAKSSPIWCKLYAVTEFVEFKDMKAVLDSIKKMSGLLTIGNAVLYKSDELKGKMGNESFSSIIGGLSGLYFLAKKDEADMMSSLYLADPNIGSAFNIWNMPDKKIMKEFYKLRLPFIEYDNKIYVERLFPLITKESILKEYKDGGLITMKSSEFQVPDLESHKEEILKTLFEKNLERVKIRIISSKPLVIQGKKRELIKAKICEFKEKLLKRKASTAEKINGVIIHIHGGGFVSMSSSSHRNYLIRWAKATGMIIFSIDYRLAPENPYPAGLDDVWQAYNWLINYSETILGIPLDKIVLTGDSAGGNLVMSLMLRAIIEEIRVPDGIMLSYPALNLYPEKVLPSYFAAIDDIILPSNVLRLCLKAYIPECFQPELDPFLSPLVASDELLSQLPPVRILSGTCDPLHDDVWKFTDRLLKLGKDVKMTIYKGLPHGFLTLDELSEYESVIGESVAKMVELLQLSEERERKKVEKEEEYLCSKLFNKENEAK